MSSFKELFVNIKRKTGAWNQSDLQHDRHWYIQDSTCLLGENKRRARWHTNTNAASDKSERSQRWSHSCNIGNYMLGLWKRLILTPMPTVTTLCKKKKPTTLSSLLPLEYIYILYLWMNTYIQQNYICWLWKLLYKTLTFEVDDSIITWLMEYVHKA